MFFEIFVIGIIIGFVLGYFIASSSITKKVAAKLDELLETKKKL
jgi:uncharacterized protein YneF (UPF0154 family)